MENIDSYLDFGSSFTSEMKEDLDCLSFRKNQCIYMEGSTPLGVYILKKGNILISKIGSQGKEQVLKILHEGEILGCTELILQKRYASSAKAITESSLLFLPKSQFFELIDQDKDLNHKLIIQFANDIQSLEQKTVNLAFKPVRGRLADSLLLLNKKTSHADSKITLSRKDIAGYTGTVKETVNRLLSEFHKEKMISMNRKEIRIIDQDHLYKISRMYE